MKIKNLNNKIILTNIEYVGNAIPLKSSIPTLTCINIKCKENKIILLGNDNKTAIKTILTSDECGFEIINEGECVVDFKLLKNIFAKLPNENNSTIYLDDNNNFIIECGKVKYKLNTMNYKDYPNIEFKRLNNEIIINTEELKKIIKNTCFATSISEKRPILTGVNFNIKDNKINCIATDSYRLSKYTIDLKNNTDDINFTIPKNSLIVLDKLLNKTKQEEIKILYDTDGKNIIINLENTLFKTILLEGKYPDTSKIISNSFNYVASVDNKQLLDSIDRLSVLSDKSDNINGGVAILHFNNDNLEITCNTNEIGFGKEILEFENKSGNSFEIKICCSIKYLIESLNVYECEKINININGNILPFTITSDNEDNLLQLLLPIKIDN